MTAAMRRGHICEPVTGRAYICREIWEPDKSLSMWSCS